MHFKSIILLLSTITSINAMALPKPHESALDARISVVKRQYGDEGYGDSPGKMKRQYGDEGYGDSPSKAKRQYGDEGYGDSPGKAKRQ